MSAATGPWRGRWGLLTVLAACQFVLVLDMTLVNLALAPIATELGAARGALTGVVNAYTVAFGGLLLLGGRWGDVFGLARTCLAGLVVFGICRRSAPADGSHDATVRPQRRA
ncbi:hypothetical protein [Amycolatopsis marina]|uniref:hypothetical protein n=1 Tax=Amycolatopsis marina TaxID=490629 RepID=UPI000B87995E|nr:hypothetical protein [Amycolatopsis marina]